MYVRFGFVPNKIKGCILDCLLWVIECVKDKQVQLRSFPPNKSCFKSGELLKAGWYHILHPGTFFTHTNCFRFYPWDVHGIPFPVTDIDDWSLMIKVIVIFKKSKEKSYN